MRHLVLVFSVVVTAVAAWTAARAQQYSPTFNTVGAERAAGSKVFSDRCGICHTHVAGVHAYGPSLTGVVGRPAATTQDFPYSDALKKSGLTWRRTISATG
jgi:cytochrome c